MVRSTTVRRSAPKAATAGPQQQWYVIDAEGVTLGRLSTMVAGRLIGKHRPEYAPNRLFGDHVVVVNAGKVVVTGRKRTEKIYRRHTGYPGGLKELPLWKALAEHPTKVIEWAVEGMLPKNRIGQRMIRNLKVYAGPQHPHEAQRPEPLALPPARKSA